MIEVGILKTWDSVNYKAGVQLAGSITTYFDNLNVARNIASSQMVVGRYVAVAIPQNNPKDAAVIAVWGSTQAKQSACYVERLAAQTLPTGVHTKIQYNSEVFDNLGEFDPTTNYDFTAKEAGLYLIIATARILDLGADKLIAIAVRKNGGVLIDNFIITPIVHELGVVALVVASLSANDKLTATVYHDHGSDRTLATGSGYNIFQIVRLA